MDILDQILNAQKGSRDEKVENFKSLFAEEDNVAVKAALAKAKQVEEMERLKSKHEQEVEALKTRHERENERLKGAKEQEVERDAIDKKREALRKANESVELEEERMSIATSLFKSYKRDIEKLMKKHDAYVSDTGLKFTFISSPKPMKGGFMKDLLKLLGMSEEVDLQEGKLVADTLIIVDVVMKKIKKQVEKEIKKNREKGLGMLNTLGSFVGHKVSDKKQEKGKLFLKFGDNLEEANEVEFSLPMRGFMQTTRKQVFDWAKKSGLNPKKVGSGSSEKLEIKGTPQQMKKLIDYIPVKDVKEERDYKKEYANYHSRPEQIKRRAKRNEARRTLKNRKGIKGKDVHHKDNNPMNNDKSNLSIVSQKYNRTEPRLRTEKLWKDFIKGEK